MDETRAAGSLKNNLGKTQESFGHVLDDAKSRAEGLANQVQGAAQDFYDQARDSASEVADAASQAPVVARQTVSGLEDSLRDAIGRQPFTFVLVGLALGWFMGRTHRPL
jgi:uncharacterized protein YjbJ (UPF0337 family)